MKAAGANATATVLPGVAAHLRAQVARQWARLWSMARSSEKAEGAGPAHYQIEGWQVRHLFESRSARSLRLAGNEREFIAIRKTLPHSARLGGGDIETITGPLSEAKSDTKPPTTCGDSAPAVHSTQVELTQPPRV